MADIFKLSPVRINEQTRNYFMIMQKKTGCLLFAVIGLTLVSLPSHAWQAARGAGGGAAVRGPNGAAVRGPNGNVAVRGGGGYHAPVAYGYRGGSYNNGYSSGQVAGAAVAGAVVGAAIANRNQPPPPPPTTVIIQQPAPTVIYQQPPTVIHY